MSIFEEYGAFKAPSKTAADNILVFLRKCDVTVHVNCLPESV